MPLFQVRTRTQIFRDMLARVVGRGPLEGIEETAAIRHVLAAAAAEDAEQYLQMARLRQIQDLSACTGSDLDDRAREIVGNRVVRRAPVAGTTPVTFSRPGTVGSLTVPAGTIAAASTDEGRVTFRTTASVLIADAASTSAPVAVVALERGTKGNVAAGAISVLVSRVPGVTGVVNAARVSNGFDRESDASFLARILDYVQALSNATPRSLRSAARETRLRDGRTVLFANLYEPVVPTGIIYLYADDGTGSVAEISTEFIGALDTPLAAAVGGETEISLSNIAIVDGIDFELYIGGVLQTRGVDYDLNPADGIVELTETAYPGGLASGDAVTANYRYYLGLLNEVQRIISGDKDSPTLYPGVRGGGIQCRVLPPVTVWQTLRAQIAVASNFDVVAVTALVEAAVQDYINTLNIGAHVIVAKIVDVAMDVGGVTDFTVEDLTGSGFRGANQIMLPNQVARIIAANIEVV